MYKRGKGMKFPVCIVERMQAMVAYNILVMACHDPDIIEYFTPRKFIGDCNCFYRNKIYDDCFLNSKLIISEHTVSQENMCLHSLFCIVMYALSVMTTLIHSIS